MVPITETTENINLKIEKCKAEKEISYNDAVMKINQTADNILKDVFNSLEQQYSEAVNKINSDTNNQISRINSDPTLTGTSKLTLISNYNNSVSEQIKTLYDNQQTFGIIKSRDRKK